MIKPSYARQHSRPQLLEDDDETDEDEEAAAVGASAFPKSATSSSSSILKPRKKKKSHRRTKSRGRTQKRSREARKRGKRPMSEPLSEGPPGVLETLRLKAPEFWNEWAEELFSVTGTLCADLPPRPLLIGRKPQLVTSPKPSETERAALESTKVEGLPPVPIELPKLRDEFESVERQILDDSFDFRNHSNDDAIPSAFDRRTRGESAGSDEAKTKEESESSSLVIGTVPLVAVVVDDIPVASLDVDDASASPSASEVRIRGSTLESLSTSQKSYFSKMIGSSSPPTTVADSVVTSSMDLETAPTVGSDSMFGESDYAKTDEIDRRPTDGTDVIVLDNGLNSRFTLSDTGFSGIPDLDPLKKMPSMFTKLKPETTTPRQQRSAASSRKIKRRRKKKKAASRPAAKSDGRSDRERAIPAGLSAAIGADLLTGELSNGLRDSRNLGKRWFDRRYFPAKRKRIELRVGAEQKKDQLNNAVLKSSYFSFELEKECEALETMVSKLNTENDLMQELTRLNATDTTMMEEILTQLASYSTGWSKQTLVVALSVRLLQQMVGAEAVKQDAAVESAMAGKKRPMTPSSKAAGGGGGGSASPSHSPPGGASPTGVGVPGSPPSLDRVVSLFSSDASEQRNDARMQCVCYQGSMLDVCSSSCGKAEVVTAWLENALSVDDFSSTMNECVFIVLKINKVRKPTVRNLILDLKNGRLIIHDPASDDSAGAERKMKDDVVIGNESITGLKMSPVIVDGAHLMQMVLTYNLIKPREFKANVLPDLYRARQLAALLKIFVCQSDTFYSELFPVSSDSHDSHREYSPQRPLPSRIDLTFINEEMNKINWRRSDEVFPANFPFDVVSGLVHQKFVELSLMEDWCYSQTSSGAWMTDANLVIEPNMMHRRETELFLRGFLSFVRCIGFEFIPPVKLLKHTHRTGEASSLVKRVDWKMAYMSKPDSHWLDAELSSLTVPKLLIVCVPALAAWLHKEWTQEHLALQWKYHSTYCFHKKYDPWLVDWRDLSKTGRHVRIQQAVVLIKGVLASGYFIKPV